MQQQYVREVYEQYTNGGKKEEFFSDYIKKLLPSWPLRLRELENKPVAAFPVNLSISRKLHQGPKNPNDVVMELKLEVAQKKYYIGSVIFKDFESSERRSPYPVVEYSNKLILQILGTEKWNPFHFQTIDLERLFIFAPTISSLKQDIGDLPDKKLLKFLQRYLYLENYLYEFCKIMHSILYDASAPRLFEKEHPSLSDIVEKFKALDREKLNRGNDVPASRFFIYALLFLLCVAIVASSIVGLTTLPTIDPRLIACIVGITVGSLGAITCFGRGEFISLVDKRPGRFRPPELSNFDVDYLLKEAEEVIELEPQMRRYAVKEDSVSNYSESYSGVISQRRHVSPPLQPKLVTEEKAPTSHPTNSK